MNKQQKYSGIQCTPAGYGHYKISMTYRNRVISCITSKMLAIDDYKSDEFEKVGRFLRKKKGFENLKAEIISKNIIR